MRTAIFVVAFSATAFCQEAAAPIVKMELLPSEWTFMEVGAYDTHDPAGKKPMNEKFFIGRLPREGEAVEMVYVGKSSTGNLRFQLRTKNVPE